MNKNMVAPCFAQNKHCFVFSTNETYAPYLSVALQSLLEHTSAQEFYDICILYTDVSLAHVQKIVSLQCQNVSIRFIDISDFLTQADTQTFVTHAHFSKEAYYRFFIPEIFSAYAKVVYVDCDMIFLENINSLLSLDLQKRPLAAVLEYKFKCKVEFDPVLKNYAKEILMLRNEQNYFNSGMLIFDIAQLNTFSFTQKCLDALKKIPRPRTVDQCIINHVMQEKVTLLNPIWNFQTHVIAEELKTYAPQKDYEEYMKARIKPRIIHYCSPAKPWNDPHIPYANIWQQYAKKTNMYLDILHLNKRLPKT